MIKNIPIYLDNQATTPIDPNVLNAMNPYLSNNFGNPASNHYFGWQAQEAIEIAREQVASIINAKTNELIFTSGATESINLGLKGLLTKHLKKGDHIITTNIEHRAVLDVLEYIQKKGIDISFVSVNREGILDIKNFEKKIKNNTRLCTIIHGNNEIGTIQQIKTLGELCKKNNIIFHVDASQTLGKRNIDVNEMNIDLLSVSGHKIYAPKGVGALYVRKKNPRIEMQAILHGGGHEFGYRSGTLSVHNIVGFGMACIIAKEKQESDNKKIKELRNLLLDGLKTIFPNLIINGTLENRLEGNLNITFPNYSAEKIMMSITEVACSTGSACTSSIPKPSHVLIALGLNKEQINNTIRFGIGRFNNMEEIKRVIDLFKKKL
tara:strand:+ start:402 stop:1538 length:1137 start_codon:yes stop_codon:yes gene_type:complete